MIRIISILMLILCLAGCATTEQKGSKSGSFDKEHAAQARINLAIAYLNEGNLHLAYRNLQKALQYNPADIQAQLTMALYEQKVGDSNAARQRYVNLLNKKNSVILNHYGAFLCSMGEYNEAQKQFKTALDFKEYEYIEDTLQNAGVCALKNNDEKTATLYFRQLFMHNPNNGKLLLLMADDYFAARDYKKVLLIMAVYESILGSNATSLGYRLRIAKLKYRINDVIQYGEQLARDFPSSQEYRRYLANEY